METYNQIPEWILLNNQVVDADGNIKDLKKDKEAVHSYFVNYVNNHTKFFHTLKEKIDYLIDNDYYEREFLEKYSFEQIKELFKYAYSFKFRFPSYMSAFKFYNDYALRDRKDTKVFLERYEDRLSIIALYHANGDFELAKRLIKSLIQQDFTPATPTLLNTGRSKRGEMVSCFLFEVGDSLNDISRSLEFAMQLSKRGGGVSLNLTNLRARGESIKETQGACKGVVGVLKLLDNAFRYADQMGQRTGAGAAYLSVLHADIEEFLSTKKINADEDSRVKTLSIGVTIPNLFVNAVKEDRDYYAFYPHTVYKEYGIHFSDVCANIDEWYDRLIENPNVKKKKISARKLLSTIASVNGESGYPYLFFQDNVDKDNVFKEMKVKFSNLCLTGDTIVATADGRNGVPISQLALESNGDKQFLVYSARERKNRTVNIKNNKKMNTSKWYKPEIKKAVAYCTGVKEVIQVNLSNGDSFRCTPNHPLALFDGGYINAEDSLGKELASLYTYSPKNTSSKRSVNTLTNPDYKQSCMIWEYFNGKRPKGYVIDHIIPRRLSNNDSIENLQILSQEEHLKKNSQEMTGKLNSAYRIVDKEVYLKNKSISSSGTKNGKFSGIDNYELIELGKKIHAKLPGEFDKNKYLKIKEFYNVNIPTTFSRYRFNNSFETYKKYVLNELKYNGEFDVDEDYIESSKNSENIKRLKYINEHFYSKYDKNTIDEKGLIVKSIEYIGEELVYDLTVEDNHNFYILTSYEDDLMENSQGVLVHNCTEILQPTQVSSYADYYDRENDEVGLGVSCNLSSGNITNIMEHNSIEETVSNAMEIMCSVSKNTDIRQVPEISKGNKLMRSVGLGMMDLHGFLAKNYILYGSEESVEFCDVFFHLVNYYSLKWSMEKAKQTSEKFYDFENTTYADGTYFNNRGPVLPKSDKIKELFKDFYIPTEEDWRILKENVMQYGLYNSHRLACAPNGSIGYVMSSTPGVTPIKQLVEERAYGNSKSYFPMPHINNNEFMYETAYNIDKFKMINVIAAIQKHIDQGISLEVCINSNVTTRELSRIQLYAHHKGLKTLYYTRTRKMKIEECLSCAV